VGNDRASLETADLAFLNVPETRLAHAARDGLETADCRVYTSLEAAQRARQPGERTLVARAEAASGSRLAPADILNLGPDRKLRAVEAAGGLVVRSAGRDAELLLIHRRGAWDLPKGKRDAGEAMEACALREVREEVGIARLALLAPAGATVHGYPEGKAYAVKRTMWYFMQTPERAYRPESGEGIEEVAWVPWEAAAARVGYESLRRHLRGLGAERALAALRGS
jgi:8-oxo-dGTP pyrophosphatase MutT (NUDIX family)